MSTESDDSKDEEFRGKVDELVKFAVNSAKRSMRSGDSGQACEMLQRHIRNLIPKNNEADQS